MTDLITAEEAEKMLDGTTPGLTDHCLYHCGKRVAECPCMRDLAAKHALATAAPDLARTVIALHAQLADAKAEQAAVVDALNREPSLTWIIANTSQVRIRDLAIDMLEHQRSLAPASGVETLAKLRERVEKAEAERDDAREALMNAGVALHVSKREVAETKAERDRLAAANVALEAKVAGLREAVDEQTKARAQHWLRRTMTAPEDAEVEALCERCGYGAVMDAASRLWARKPHGSGAFYIGGCIGFKSDEEARAALATQEAGT